MKRYGGVVTWGDGALGAHSEDVADQLHNVVHVDGHNDAGSFAALKRDRSVVTWGCDAYGGNSDAVREQLVDVVDLVP